MVTVQQQPVNSVQQITGTSGGSATGQQQRLPPGRPPLPHQQQGGHRGQSWQQQRDNYGSWRYSHRSFRAQNSRQNHRDVDSEGFTLVQGRRRRPPRVNGQGGASGVDGLQGAPFPVRQIWVGRVMNGNSDKIKTFLVNNNVDVKTLKEFHIMNLDIVLIRLPYL